MRILIYGINYSPELTGIGKYSGEMAEWLAARGHTVQVVTAPPYYPQWRVLDGYRSWCYRREFLNGVDVRRCPLWVPSHRSGLKRILHLASFALSSLPVMLRQIFWRPDIVFVVEPTFFCTPIALLISKLSKAKFWLHVQDFEVDAAFDLGLLSSPLLRRMVLGVERWLMRRFDVVSTISERMLERVKQKGVLSNRCEMFVNWVDTGQIYPLDKPSSFREGLGVKDEIVALYSGNLGEKQGLEIIIDSARLLADENIKFVICGDGAAKNKLVTLSAGMENIIWLPLQPVEKLNDFLNLADIHLLPQRGDAADLVMPSKLTGMLASGRSVVAAAPKGSQIDEILQGCGLVVEPGNSRQFTDAINKLADMVDLRLHLGQQARKYALESLGRETVLSNLEKSLLALVGGQ